MHACTYSRTVSTLPLYAYAFRICMCANIAIFEQMCYHVFMSVHICVRACMYGLVHRTAPHFFCVYTHMYVCTMHVRSVINTTCVHVCLYAHVKRPWFLIMYVRCYKTQTHHSFHERLIGRVCACMHACMCVWLLQQHHISRLNEYIFSLFFRMSEHKHVRAL
jgi:hypothetical protein